MDFCDVCDGILEIKRVDNKLITYCTDCDEYNQIGGGDQVEIILDKKDVKSLIDIIRDQSLPREKRIEAISSIEDVEVLEKLVFDISSVSVLIPLIDRIKSKEILKRIAKTTKSSSIWEKAIEKIETVENWLWLAINTEEKSLRGKAQGMLTDDKILLKALKEENDTDLIETMVLRLEGAINSITDEELLKLFAQYSENNRYASLAIKRINDEQILKELVKSITYYKQNIECVDRISDQQILEELLDGELYWRIVVAIVKKLKNPERLYEIALKEQAFGIFRTAIINLSNQSENEKLINLAIHASHNRSRIEAIKRVDEIDVLKDIYDKEKNEEVKWVTNKRIETLQK